MLFSGLVDYSTDIRGDVGSWVREASINGLEKLLVTIYSKRRSEVEEIFSEEKSHMAMSLLLRQSVDRIDRVRTCAGKLLEKIAWNYQSEKEFSLPYISQIDVIQKAIPR